MTFARARHIPFLVCVNNPLVLTGGVKFGQSEGIPDSGIPERLPLRKFHRRSLVLSPSLPSFFPALSLALVFARAPLSERLEQAKHFNAYLYSTSMRRETQNNKITLHLQQWSCHQQIVRYLKL